MSLQSGKKIKCHKWEELPITEEVITRVERLAQDEGQLKLIDRCPLFEWEDGLEVEDDIEMTSENEVHIDEYGDRDFGYESSDDEDESEAEHHILEEENKTNI